VSHTIQHHQSFKSSFQFPVFSFQFWRIITLIQNHFAEIKNLAGWPQSENRKLETENCLLFVVD